MKWISILLVFAAVTSCNNSNKINKKWVANEISSEKTLESNRPYVDFTSEGKFSGNSSCNQFFGEYKLNDMKVSFSNIGATKKLCAPEISDQELKFFDAFHSVESFEINKGLLNLISADGQIVLKFEEAK